jgi:hypothetical protein
MLPGVTTSDLSQHALQQLASTAIAKTTGSQPVKVATRQVTTPAASQSSMALKQVPVFCLSSLFIFTVKRAQLPFR